MLQMKQVFHEEVSSRESSSGNLPACGLKVTSSGWFVKPVRWTDAAFTLQTGLNKRMCQECIAGSTALPYEDVVSRQSGHPHSSKASVGRMYTPPLGEIPLEPAGGPPEIFQRDTFHTLRTGVFRDFAASCRFYLCECWSYCTDPDDSSSVDAKQIRMFSDSCSTLCTQNWRCQTLLPNGVLGA